MQESKAGSPPYDACELYFFETIKLWGIFCGGGGQNLKRKYPPLVQHWMNITVLTVKLQEE